MVQPITPAEAKSRIHAPQEVALIDVREAGEFGEGHLLFAVPCPYSRLEIDFPLLVPRTSIPIILVDGGDAIADRAAVSLASLGYSDISIIAGGVPAWAAAGFGVYKGVNVPGKLLGEVIEHAAKPDRITAETLQQWQQDGREFLFFDTRPPAEYAKMRVPGAACVPNGELAHRFAAAVPDPGATVVITCAGRTRGLIGAAGLRVAGITNPVYALENGTQGWMLAGFELERGNTAEPYPELNAATRQDSTRRARSIMERDGIATVDVGRIEEFLSDASRTAYLIDVRSSEEARSEPIAAARHALSGQIVQSTDNLIGTRRSRVVLICDTGLRSALAAYWLKRLGYEAYVHIFTPETRSIAKPRPIGMLPPEPRAISPADARAMQQAGGGVLIDLRHSSAFRASHAVGAHWSIRPRFGRLANLRGRTALIFTDDAHLVQIAVTDLGEAGAVDVLLVEGGIDAWRQAGLGTIEGDESPKPAEAIDFLLFVHDRHDGNLESSRLYLAWEQGLMAQTDAAERAEFNV